MIRADWATPPDGDFARYVDQLMARSAQARLRASHTPMDGFDGAAHGGAVEPAGPPMSRSVGVTASERAPGQEHVDARAALAGTVVRGLRQWAASPPDGTGWGRWLQERLRVAATAPRPANAATRQRDPRLNNPPRKP